MTDRRMSVLKAWLLCLLISQSCSSIGDPQTELPIARDLHALGLIAKEKNQPILLSLAQQDCPYCEKLKAEILRPMLISGEYEHKIMMREFLMDPWEQAVDFSGRKVAAPTVAERYKVWVTPTLLFLSPEGDELAPRILGINTVEMYSFYVDEAIDKAQNAMQSRSQETYRPTPEDIGAWPTHWDPLD
jgi:thioredoxin-related protein